MLGTRSRKLETAESLNAKLAVCAWSLQADTPQQSLWLCGFFYSLFLVIFAPEETIPAEAKPGLSWPMRWSSVSGPAPAPASDGLNPGVCNAHCRTGAQRGGGRRQRYPANEQSPASCPAGSKLDVSWGTHALCKSQPKASPGFAVSDCSATANCNYCTLRQIPPSALCYTPLSS